MNWLLVILIVLLINCVECKQWMDCDWYAMMLYDAFFTNLNSIFLLLGARSALTLDVLNRLCIQYRDMELDETKNTILSNIVICMKKIIEEDKYIDYKKSWKRDCKGERIERVSIYNYFSGKYNPEDVDCSSLVRKGRSKMPHPENLVYEDGKCPICNNVIDGEDLVFLDCLHKYHSMCVSKNIDYNLVKFKCWVCPEQSSFANLLSNGVVFKVKREKEDYTAFSNILLFTGVDWHGRTEPIDLNHDDKFDFDYVIQSYVLEEFNGTFGIGEVMRVDEKTTYFVIDEFYNETLSDMDSSMYDFMRLNHKGYESSGSDTDDTEYSDDFDYDKEIKKLKDQGEAILEKYRSQKLNCRAVENVISEELANEVNSLFTRNKFEIDGYCQPSL